LIALLAQAADEHRPTVIVVVGAAGEAAYGAEFEKWAARWDTAANQGSAEFHRIGPRSSDGVTGDESSQTSDRDRLQEALKSQTVRPNQPLWLVLIGHGTFDGREAKLNLRGPDISADELAAWLKPIDRPIVVINCTSSSGPFLKPLSAAGRAVITATRSGHEHNFARFGDYVSASIADPTADLDKDGQTSLLEAYLAAAHRTEEFYKADARLTTEHALLDDNGDGLGTPADWFQGTRATRRAKDGAALDGARAHQLHLVKSAREQAMPAEVRAKRDELELAIESLRDQKAALAESDYYERLEKLLVELARLYDEADTLEKSATGVP
jgi:hypothetical protein